MKFAMNVSVTTHYEVVVEADSPEQARDQVMQMDPEKFTPEQYVNQEVKVEVWTVDQSTKLL